MDRATKEAAITMIKSDSKLFRKRYLEIMTTMREQSQDVMEHFKNMIEQIPARISGPLIPKTPKVVRKKVVPKIETIPEDATIAVESLSPAEDETEDDTVPVRSRRAASQRATESIRKQQSETLNAKLRRPSEEPTQIVRSKRAKNSNSSSDDELNKRPSKISKMEEKKSTTTTKRLRQIKVEPISQPPTPEKTINNKNETLRKLSDPPRRSQRTSSKKSDDLGTTKKTIIIDETMDIVDDDVTVTEPSMYEDAVGSKLLPMNSTMLNPNSTMTIDRKLFNVTVVLEKVNDTTRPLSQKNSIQSINGSRKNSVKEQEKTYTVETPSERAPPPLAATVNNTLKKKLQALKKHYQQRDELITDDESSPERKNTRNFVTKKQKKVSSPLVSDEDNDDDDDSDEVAPSTPLAELSKMKNKKLKHKANALFSPYGKESVKKKVEAFEQAVKSPVKIPVAIDAPTRVTRTKTRAMKAAEDIDNDLQPPITLAQKLARKSIAKAKKISLNCEKRKQDEGKENALESAQKQSTRLQKLSEKLMAKQKERITPVKKSRLQMPMSVTKLHQTPAKQVHLPIKPLTASKIYNMGSSTESLTISKPNSKLGSTDSLNDKKKAVVDEDDARWRKEEAMKQQSEDKRRRREEKELKNKLAREAKERLEQEKRLRMEKEREEKARAAQLAQERAREEAEKKRQIQLQRAQEKEERRKYEEQMKQQRLQEQEEIERKLAEQKRREQEAERRRQQEARNQQLAAAEKERLKQLQLIAKAKHEQQLKNNPNTYIIDSDPDDDESDDESRPKHPIPQWAHSSIRKSHLEMQQNIPIEIVLRFFGAKSHTPDLQELFVGIKKDKLIRTSSANWKSAPRFSMMDD